jgi:hypothetical protein
MKGHGSLNCGGCGAKLVNCLFFCLPCWQLLPGKERASLYAMHNRRQDTDSKVAKCVRILKDKRTAAGFATSGLTLEKLQRCKEILDRAEVPTDGRMMA